MLLSGRIENKSSKERRLILQNLMDSAVLPQRRRLLQYRDHTWQSAYVDDDGYLAEMIASIVLGVPGVTRRGVTRSAGDLRDETEVKKGYRLDPNIDFILAGRWDRSANAIELEYLPAELSLPDIRKQLNSNACSIQPLRRDTEGRVFGGALARTTGKRSLRPAEGALHRLHLARGSLANVKHGERLEFSLRQERGHINFGRKSRGQLDDILRRRPVFVYYQHDPRGRFQLVVVRSELTAGQRRRLLDEIFAGTPDRQCQVQPYLFPDNERTALAASSKHSLATALGGKLLALGVETAQGFAITHWDPDGEVPVLEAEDLLTQVAPLSECPLFHHTAVPLDIATTEGRRAAAASFFRHCMSDYYERLHPYCDLTATMRNMAFGNLSQHLVSLVVGIRGTRSGARGADLVELDGSPSEVKLATGQQGGDAMSTEDSPRLTLGWDQKKMLSWKRLFAVRIVDGGSGLSALVQAPTEGTMSQFRQQVSAYFAGRVNNGSGGLQYHAIDKFPHDSYGPRDRRLLFVRIGEFHASSSARFPNPVPAFNS